MRIIGWVVVHRGTGRVHNRIYTTRSRAVTAFLPYPYDHWTKTTRTIEERRAHAEDNYYFREAFLTD